MEPEPRLLEEARGELLERLRRAVGQLEPARLPLHRVCSLDNDSPREPDDRFGGNATFSFNRASMGRVGAGLIVPLPVEALRDWNIEVGYNKWIWGRSARRYQEPYVSFGHSW